MCPYNILHYCRSSLVKFSMQVILLGIYEHFEIDVKVGECVASEFFTRQT